jgi:uridine phosphorylase
MPRQASSNSAALVEAAKEKHIVGVLVCDDVFYNDIRLESFY